MMLPEISRRCSSCGASIRERALFCPECGRPLRKDSEALKLDGIGSAAASNVETSTEPEGAKNVEPAALAESGPATNTSSATAELQSNSQAAKQEARDSAIKTEMPLVYGAVKHEGTRERLHRASSVARVVVEDEVKRVERIRHVSSAMIEEASYDPSLRFVLVAVGLFVVVIILLVLSKVMG